MLHPFLSSESGAITVDWTVMAAAVVGLGVSSVAAVRTGQSALAGDINGALTSAGVANLNAIGTRGSYGFEDGDTAGWSASRLTNHALLGTFLGPFAGSEDTLTQRVALPDGATSATVSFDLLVLDSWDGTLGAGRGDGIAFEIDGVEIGFSTIRNVTNEAGTPTGTFEVNGTTYAYEMTRHSGGTWYSEGSPQEWPDSRWSVAITATNPPSGGFTLGLNSTTDQSVSDESFGIDNYRVTATTP